MSKFVKTIQIAGLALVAVSSLALTACKTKNDNSSPVVTGPPPNWQVCPTCTTAIGQPIPGLVGVRAMASNQNLLFSFDLIVNQSPNVNWNDPKAILAYQGPVTLQGVLRIVSAGDYMVCNAPPGDYEIRPLTSSMLARNGILSNGTFEALSGNGSRILFRIGTSVIVNGEDPRGVSRDSQTNRAQLNLIFDQVNGALCNGQIATY